ncbi:BrnT family toxin [Cyanobacterium sp. Dongsha4]|uniref:BrnT family toxin n=1 Tax=Cyanobacterium sp. DS4 TaxID=2878255 RepID=UPI002E80BC59|nr:BrnT family toxin [Cyanobacterium sp. Dongsha4]WVL00756.1 BrnT family toxin [Cyanobacterium sp. Dongsha4]
MDIFYNLQGSEFEWNNEKAEANIIKHGISFEESAEVFFDPFYQTGDATRNDETREFIIGYSLNYRLLLVVFIERNQRIRIISARKATSYEQKLYEQS